MKCLCFVPDDIPLQRTSFVSFQWANLFTRHSTIFPCSVWINNGADGWCAMDNYEFYRNDDQWDVCYRAIYAVINTNLLNLLLWFQLSCHEYNFSVNNLVECEWCSVWIRLHWHSIGQMSMNSSDLREWESDEITVYEVTPRIPFNTELSLVQFNESIARVCAKLFAEFIWKVEQVNYNEIMILIKMNVYSILFCFSF